MTTPPPNQPPNGQPGAAYGQGNPFAPQSTPPGSPGFPPPGSPGFPPAGAPGFPPPGAPGFPPPPPARPNNVKRIVIPILAVLGVLVVAAFVALSFMDRDSGTSIESSPVGSCITVTKSTAISVETEAIDCTDTSPSTYLVGAKLASSDACKQAKYRGYISEAGSGAADTVLCLIPNYQVGTCYKESQISVGLDLETEACSTESSTLSTVYRITERAESKTVPNCSGATKKVIAYDIQTDPARQVGFCAEILGDYTWEE